LSIHYVLKKRLKNRNWVNLSSILMVNKNIPRFEECFYQLDYDWLLKVTKNRSCIETEARVIRYVYDKNLSKNKEYRKRDTYMGLLISDPDTKTMKRWLSSRARYHYKIDEPKMARFFFIRGEINLKTILYYLTSYSKLLRYIVISKYNVFG